MAFQYGDGRGPLYDNAVFLELSESPIRGTVCHSDTDDRS
jgi:hypothetical protein